MKAWVKVVSKPCHCEAAKRPKQSRYILAIIILAIAIKLSLFAFAVVHAPQGKILPDSPAYLKLADILVSRGAFATQSDSGVLVFETFRTPGYPLFLAIFHGLINIPLDGIILIQIAMTLLTVFITYKTALQIEPRMAFLSAAIILFDPPITIFSLTILTESLFLLLISLFMLSFTLYLKHKNTGFAATAALTLAMATYVRPVSYYLGFVMAFFMIYANRKEGLKKVFKQVFVFVLIVYSLLGIWQIRNCVRCHDPIFSAAGRENLRGKGLFKSYARNADPYTKGMAPLPYYINVSTRCLMSIMTRPGNFKYFKSDILTASGKVLAYPWTALWMAGFVWGITKVGRNLYLQFMFFVVLYFIVTSVGALMWDVCERLRVPMMPFIAIISAYGWINLLSLVRKQ